MTEEHLTRATSSQADEDLNRRQWLLRLGEMVVLVGVSGLVPESAAALLGAGQGAESTGATALPPGLYDPSQEHLVHALSSAGKKWVPPPGSETDYVQPGSLPFQPQFFSPEEFRVVTRFVETLLGNADPPALSQATHWFDLWLYSAAGVRAAAQHLDPLHRAVAVAVNGQASVCELETADPQAVARAGLAALHDLSVQAHDQEFLLLTAPQQVDLLTSAGTAQPGNALRKFFEMTRTEAIRGYYTSAAGLKELDYKGNAYYSDSPGCEMKS
jgi:gluconate 2-dehydrogenase subunit 3-like protein